MKRLTAFICAAAMTLGMTMTAAAAPSIGSLIPEAPTVVSGNIPEGYSLAVQEANTANYTNATVASVVDRFNDDTVVLSVAEALTELGVDTTAPVTTESGLVVDITACEALTPFVDLAISDGTNVEYTVDGEITATLVVEVAKDLTAEDLLLMQVNPETGDVYFIEVEEYDPATGSITATFPCLGPFTVLTGASVQAADAAETEAAVQTEAAAETEAAAQTEAAAATEAASETEAAAATEAASETEAAL